MSDKKMDMIAAHTLVEAPAMGIVTLDRDYKITHWNSWMEKHSDIEAGNILGKNIFKAIPNIEKRNKGKYIADCVENGKPAFLSAGLHRHIIPLDTVKDKKSVPMLQNTRIYPANEPGAEVKAIIYIEDTTEQIFHLEEISRLTRILKAIRNIDKLIAVVQSEKELFDGTCEILTNQAGYAISLIASIEAGGFEVQSFAGVEAGDDPPACLKKGKLSDAGYCVSIAAKAVDTGKAQVVNRIDKNNLAPACMKAGEKIGCSAFCSLPLAFPEDRRACLNVFSTETDVFKGDELDLLEEIAGDISLCIESLQHERKRREAEEERRKLDLQAQHAQKLESLGVLAGGIAHDFNNLLTGILGNASLVQMELSPASPVRDCVDEIEMASRRAADLCRQMLAYSGRGRFVVEPVNLNEIVDEMTHLLEISISKKAVLKYDLAENLPAVEADATQIRQVIMNLITNASEAVAERSGVISISTGAMECDRSYLNDTYLADNIPAGAYAYIEVSDSGCGMDEETRNKVFDPFFTTKFTGHGLGLATVLGIVRGHKGAINICTEPRKGSTFKVLFPLPDESLKLIVKEKQKEQQAWHGTGTVLFVDDEETVRTTGKRMLKTLGFTVITAVDGREAVEVFREHESEIDLVLLDLTMPHMGGEEVFREMRKIRSDVRVILSSGYNEQEVIDRFTSEGLAGFIQKPYRYETLTRKIRGVLGD